MKPVIAYRFSLLGLLGAATVATACIAAFQWIEHQRALDPESAAADFVGIDASTIKWSSAEAPQAMPESGIIVIPKHEFSSNKGFVRGISLDQPLGTLTIRNHRGVEAFALQCGIGGFASDGWSDYYLQVFAEEGGVDDGAALVIWHFEEASKTLTIDMYVSYLHHSRIEHTELRFFWNGSSFTGLHGREGEVSEETDR